MAIPLQEFYIVTLILVTSCSSYHLNHITKKHIQPIKTINDTTKHKNWQLLDFGNSCGQSKWQGNKGNIIPQPRVLGGWDASKNEFPWIVQPLAQSIYTRDDGRLVGDQLECGGAIINDRYVLTAAHCCIAPRSENFETVTTKRHVVRLSGDKDGHSDKTLELAVEKLKIHEEFEDQTLTNDICLIRLQKRLTFSDQVHPICLPFGHEWKTKELIGLKVTAAGWGATSQNAITLEPTHPDRLQKVVVPVVPTSKCIQEWRNSIFPVNVDPETQFCAGNSKKDVCRGDSGGPIMYMSSKGIEGPSRYFLLGLVSFGEHCTTEKEMRPSVFVKVSNYLLWILDNIYE